MAVNHQESPQKRLDNLRQFLAAELKEDKPAQQYVDDLRVSIRRLEKQLKLPAYSMVPSCS